MLPSEELARRPKIFRIVGWVMVIYGAAGLVGGVAFGKLWAFIAEKTGFNWGKLSSNMNVEQTAVTIGRVIGTVTTLFSAAICSAGVIFLSAGSNISAKRAEESMGLMPTVAFVPLPGGGYAVMGGLGGRM